MKDTFHIADLIVKKIKGAISPEEWTELESWMNESPENLAVYKRATDRKSQINKLEVYELFRKDKVWSALEDELFKTKTVRFTSHKFFRLAAAIILPMLIVGGAAYLYLNNPGSSTLADLDAEIKPGSQKAVLILSDGASVELVGEDAPADIREGDVKINNRNSRLSYSAGEPELKQRKEIYNKLVTPRGGGYNLQLADGTGVWLNAGSSLRFPVSFTDSTRQVFLEGEAYFDVSHNGKPFIVSSGDMDVRVLGTSFNVSAYADDSEFKTTLVEGKVRVEYSGDSTSAKISTVLTPNNQAVLNLSANEISIAEVNTSTYTSWMDGKLEFSNEDLDIVMKRLARWYDFEYEFENVEAKGFHFSARLSREENISAILEMLEMTSEVKFELRDNKIVVL